LSRPTKPFVLILSADATIAALLGALVELEGYEPLFPDVSETADQALTRLRARVSVVDAHFATALSDVFYARARMLDARVILLSPTPLPDHVRDISDRFGFKVLTVPLDRAQVSKTLMEAMTR
jgi:hypothetical protein